MTKQQRRKKTPQDRRAQVLCTGLTFLFFAVSLIRVEACPVCFLMPTKTVADYIIESEFVVLARENPDIPFSYSLTERLKGQTTTEDFGLFVDSSTRRRLKANPEDVVVLVRLNSDQEWHSLGIADAQFQEIVKRILAYADHWKSNDGVNDRYRFFLSLLGNENRTVFELAYLELGRAPYSKIKEMAEFISPNEIRPILLRREYYQWRPLAIMLLAQNPSEKDRKLIEDSFDMCNQFSIKTNLAAWTTAYIEINGLSALDVIEEKYLSDANRTELEIRSIIIALSVHGLDGQSELRERIIKSYGLALQNHPHVTGLIVNDLKKWNKPDYRERIREIIKQSGIQFDRKATKAIMSFLDNSSG